MEGIGERLLVMLRLFAGKERAAFSNPKMSLKSQDIRLGLISFRFWFERDE
jgi:hypothetical protein